MCGRYVTPEEAEIERFWNIGRRNNNPLPARFNVSPTAIVPIVHRDADALRVSHARWGLIPIWWRQPKPPNFTFNARIEEAAGKPMWRNAVRGSRCIVPALGWYEWRETETIDPDTGDVRRVKQPHYLHLPGHRMLGFAGLMSARAAEYADAEAPALSCAIITRAAQGAASEVHDRMPLILSEAAQSAWLDPSARGGEEILSGADRDAVIDIAHHPVSRRVSNSRNQGAELIERAPGQEQSGARGV